MSKPGNCEMPSREAVRGMRLAIAAQCFGFPLLYSLTHGGMATLYAQRFGAQDFMVGVVNGCLSLGLLVTLAMPGLIERFNKRPIIVVSQATAIIAFLPILFLPWLAARSGVWALVCMAAAFLLYSCCNGGFNGSWFPALLDFVPVRKAGHFFGQLRMWWQTVMIVLYVFMPMVIGDEAATERFALVFAVMLGGVFVRMVLLTRLPQRPVHRSDRKGLGARLALIWSDKAFVRYAVFGLAARGTAALIFPTMIVYAKHLGVSERMLVVAILARMMSAAASYIVWGRMTDRHGPGRAYRLGLLLVCGGLLVWLPASYAARASGDLGAAQALIVLSFVVLSAGEAGVGLAVSRHGFQLTPVERAPTYLSLQPNFIRLTAGVGQLLVGIVLSVIHAQDFRGWVNPYVVLLLVFAVSSAGLIPLVGKLSKTDQAH